MHIKVNWWAILVSDIVLFLLGWLLVRRVLWQGVAGRAARGHTASQHGVHVVCVCGLARRRLLLAYGLALILKWRGAVGPLEGAWIGFAFGLLIFGTMTWMDYVYSGWGAALGFINTGFVSVGMGVMGAILAAWKPRGA